MTGRTQRVDERGRTYAGSQLQIQIHVNRHSNELSQHITDALPDFDRSRMRLRWVSPLEEEGFTEYYDRAFFCKVGLSNLFSCLIEFWPGRGRPYWDALAVVEDQEDSNFKGIVLVEAKSHPSEVYGDGCKAVSPTSCGKIKAALEKTQRWLGVSGDVDWMGPLYQSANRLAHLYFFREIADVPAWLVNIYFLDDRYSSTSRKDWDKALSQVKTELGLADITIPHAPELFLKARDRSELVG